MYKDETTERRVRDFGTWLEEYKRLTTPRDRPLLNARAIVNQRMPHDSWIAINEAVRRYVDEEVMGNEPPDPGA